MKRKIEFNITVGSVLPEKEYEGQILLPLGGTWVFQTIEFETDNIKPMDDALVALKEEMKNESYHIWYWTWLN